MVTFRKCCNSRPKLTVNKIKSVFPIVEWLPKYNLKKFLADIIAGIAVGMMIIPQSLAHAIIAGLKPQYGLYSSFPAMFVYLFLGTSKDVSIGTTVITALLTNRYSVTNNVMPEIVAILTFIAGVVMVTVAICRLGFVVRFLSFPVISGFVSASSIIIITSQLRYLLGLSRPPRMIFLKLKYIFSNLKYTRPGDITMGVICLIILFALQFGAPKFNSRVNADSPKWRRIVGIFLTVIGVGRNALVAILAIIVSYIFDLSNLSGAFKTVGDLPDELPPIRMPVKSVTINGNETLSVGEIISGFGSGIGVVPLIIVLQSVAASKALGRMNKYKIDTFQEIVALGIGNVFGSFFNAIPMTASFSRSAVNSRSGSATPFAGVITSLIVILAIEVMSPIFEYCPMSSLSAIVIAAVVNLFDYNMAIKLWHSNKIDLVVWLVTFFGCIYEIEIGIAIGLAISLAIVLHREFNPRLNISIDKESRKLIITLHGGVWFLGIESIASHISKKLDKEGSFIETVVIDCGNMLEVDYTVIHGLHEILADCSLNNVQLEFINVKGGKIKHMLLEDKLIKGGTEEVPLESIETGPLIPNGNTLDNTAKATA